jgi:hypothetical protein
MTFPHFVSTANADNQLREFAKHAQATFSGLEPIDRSKLLNRGRSLGLSNRSMAKAIGVSEGTVRNYLLLLKLPLQERQALTSDKTYRRALRRIGEIKELDNRAKEATEARIVEEIAAKGFKVIKSLFLEIRLASAFAEQVLEEAKFRIWAAEDTGALKSSETHWAKEYKDIIVQEKPENLSTLEGVDYLNAVIVWFCRWMTRVMPNSRSRSATIDLALERAYSLGV